MPAPISERRYVVVSPRTIGIAIGGFILAASALVLVYEARRVLTWVLIATFLALALNRIVALLERWLPRTAAAVMTFALALAAVSGVGYLVVPVLVDQAAQLVNQIPDLIQRLSELRGPLGVVERRFDVVDRSQELVSGGFGERALGLSGPLASAAKGAVTTVIGVFAISFLTLFLLLCGPRWREALIAAAPEEQQLLWERISDGVYRSVGGWVLGAIVLGAIAGGSATLVLLVLGVPYAVALGVLVGALDPIPFVGATLAGVMCGAVVLATEGLMPALIFVGFILVYQNVIENHMLVPLVYARTVELDSLGVLIAVLIGAELGGIIGALLAVPTGGLIRVVVSEIRRWRRKRGAMLLPEPGFEPEPADRCRGSSAGVNRAGTRLLRLHLEAVSHSRPSPVDGS
jgi:predicted PurR-regulated permease PerM